MSIPWTIDAVEQYKKKINFKSLSINEKLNWNIEFIRKYKNKLSWDSGYELGLGSNSFIPWSKAFVLEFESNLDISAFISDYNMIVHLVIIPHLNDITTNQVLDKIRIH